MFEPVLLIIETIVPLSGEDKTSLCRHDPVRVFSSCSAAASTEQMLNFMYVMIKGGPNMLNISVVHCKTPGSLSADTPI